MTAKRCTLEIFIAILLLSLYSVKSRSKSRGIIYILHWTRKDIKPYVAWKLKRKSFTIMNCKYQNCYLTDDANYFGDLTYFDAILINSIYIVRGDFVFPEIRSSNQAYIFVSSESAYNYPIRSERFNWFFNYTWTYKLTSDIMYPYLIARNKSNGEMVAPKEHVNWIKAENVGPLPKHIEERISSKRTAVAWIASNCIAPHTERFNYVTNLREALSNYNLDMHIYGNCGSYDCARENMDECLQKIETEYYFYIAFENSVSEDYVTEKLLVALDHFAVPVVMGGANYSRFMPDGIYLNAQNKGEDEVARSISAIINDRRVYNSYFRWHQYYSYHESWESGDTDPLCGLCAFLNGDWKKQRRVYARFTDWWNEDKHKVPQNISELEGMLFYYSSDLFENTITRPASDVPVRKKSMMDHVEHFVDTLYNYLLNQ